MLCMHPKGSETLKSFNLKTHKYLNFSPKC